MTATRELGRSGLHVRPLAFGGNVFGWSADEKASFALLDAFVDAGFNLVDTADVYSAWVPGNSGGESETLIGKWFARSGKRDKVVLATKVAKWAERPGLTPDNINAAVEDSLRRLQTDVIDLYQAHEDDESTPLEATLAAFGRLIEAGKVRAIGASNYSATRLADALKVSTDYKLPRYETLQPGTTCMTAPATKGTGTAGAARADRRDRLLRAGQWLPQWQVPHAGRCSQEPGTWRDGGEALSEPARPAHPAGAG